MNGAELAAAFESHDRGQPSPEISRDRDMSEFEAQVLADLCVLKNQMATLLGDGQTGRLCVLERRVEHHELRWQRAKGFAVATGLLFALLRLAVEVIRRH